VNVRHHFFAIQAAVPMMRTAGGGSIVNLGSISWHVRLEGLPGYSTAKAGIEGLSRIMAPVWCCGSPPTTAGCAQARTGWLMGDGFEPQ
jgi:NAD(P)-dependent dehydrogenase (short-subunit alcohol dehydrogenase family)